MGILLNQIIPYKNLSFLGNYLELVKNKKFFYSKATVKRKFTILTLKLIITLCNFAYLYVFPAKTTYQIAIHYDLVTIGNLPKEVNFIAIGIIALTIYFIKLLYFTDFWKINVVLYNILILEQSNFFICFTYKKRLVYKILKQFSYVIVNLFQVFIVVIGKYNKSLIFFTKANHACLGLLVLISQYYVNLLLFKDETYHLFNIFYYIKVLVAEVNLMFLYNALYLFSYTNILIALHAITLLFAITIKLYHNKYFTFVQNNTGTNKVKQKALMLKFLSENLKILSIIVETNKFYGKAFFAFLVVNNPSNCLLVASIFMKNLTFTIFIFVATVALQQFVCNFGIHLFIASINNKFKSHSKLYIKTYMKFKCFSGAHKIKLGNYIELFNTGNTVKPYGFTYANVGKFLKLNVYNLFFYF